MINTMQVRISLLILLIGILLTPTLATAELSYVDPATGSKVLDEVVKRFYDQANSWRTVIQAAAERLFWVLVLISMVWTFGMMLLRKADIGEFFAEFTRFIIFTGLYFWFLTNAVTGQNIALSLITSMEALGKTASGSVGAQPSNIMDVGYQLMIRAVDAITMWQPIDSAILLLMTLIILIILTVIAVNMMLLLIASWILLYAGIFFLGFGGARWTSDIAIQYFKTVLAIGVQLLGMILIVAIGSDILTNSFQKMSSALIKYEELAVMTILAIAILMLSSKIPALLAGIITGGSAGMASSIGSSVGAMGSSMTAAGMAYAAAQYGFSHLKNNPMSNATIAEAMKASTMSENETVQFTANRNTSNDIPRPFKKLK